MQSCHLTHLANLYDHRSPHYDTSWHPSFAHSLLLTALHSCPDLPTTTNPIHIDLATGTGLVALSSLSLLPLATRVYGLDISNGMLAQFRAKISTLPPEQRERVRVLEGDMSHPLSHPEIAGLQGQVDLITCASAFVLLPDSAAREGAMKEWAKLAKRGTGRLVFDVPHEHNLRVGMVMEFVAAEVGCGLQVPSSRRWIPGEESVRWFVEGCGGWEVESIELVAQTGLGTRWFDSGQEEAVRLFEELVANEAYVSFREVGEEVRERAREVFVRLWKEAGGEEGRVEDVDGVYVVVARRTDD